MSNCRQQPKVHRPTKAQRLAFAKLVQRDGEKHLTKMEAVLLGSHPFLTFSQRQHFSELAAKL